MRVLVTGSQLWDDSEFIWNELDDLLDKYGAIILVHGGCPNGADAHAAGWADTRELDGYPVRAESHPAQWRKNGKLDKSAGFRRNAEMVKLGADVCLAFILDDSPGSTHTANLAEKAGIETIRFTRSTKHMIKRVNDDLQLLEARLMWRNFSGEERLFNEKGKRNFAIPLDEELALHLREIGWNVRDNSKKVQEAQARGEELDLLYHLSVTVKMDGKLPPRIFLITKKWSEEKQQQVPARTLLDEDTVGLLDYAEFENVDLTLRPYNWKMKSGAQGVTAYLKTFYGTLRQDPLDEKYAHIPLEGYDDQLAIESGDDIIDVEGEWVDDSEMELTADELRDIHDRKALERGRA